MVSVIIPHYNNGALLPEAVASATAQTWQDLEIIISDDGSDPDCEPVLNSFTDPRITVLRNPHGGVSAARNTAIAAARGKYIVSLDSDDKMEPSFIEKGLRHMEADADLGLVTCRRRYFGSSNNELRHRDMTAENILLGKAHSGGFGMFRKSDWEKTAGYDTNLQIFEDWDFWLQLLALGKKFKRIEEVLYLYREHPVSTIVKYNHTGGGYVHFTEFDPRLYLFQKHQALYLKYPELLVSKIFGTPEKPRHIPARRRKYRLTLLLDKIPFIRRLFAGRIDKARQKLEYLSHF